MRGARVAEPILLNRSRAVRSGKDEARGASDDAMDIVSDSESYDREPRQPREYKEEEKGAPHSRSSDDVGNSDPRLSRIRPALLRLSACRAAPACRGTVASFSPTH